VKIKKFMIVFILLFIIAVATFADYKANFSPDGKTFTVYATGFHQAGSKVSLEIVDPQLVLFFTYYLPIMSDAMISYKISLTLDSSKILDSIIIIIDKQGAHKVPIRDLSGD